MIHLLIMKLNLIRFTKHHKKDHTDYMFSMPISRELWYVLNYIQEFMEDEEVTFSWAYTIFSDRTAEEYLE